ncbi:zinc-binding alcohol dehydrogenase family protein [Nocardioides zeae]|uniref:Alcohol dehydrogenase catalytic domain-containing protein n=2 Tax=Nocardioides zeae TaxID=1457234 RepID=A0A6P0HMC7_9ACTN|nr:alcohol dehydrogenase catalytic domain-containing protein [Nocardioides zeae]NEN79746.1 alcohol dehydrogenase catalytic domain-containing protein [Nocardioides zeae]
MASRYVEVAPGELSVRTEEFSHRPLAAGEARVQVLACGICGTDLHLWHGMPLPPGSSYPVRPGHEVCGRVVEMATAPSSSTGPAGHEPAVGDMVVLHPVAPCGACDSCALGLDQLCPRGRVLGIHEPGGLSDEVVWPADRMVPVTGIEPTQAAVLADAVATAYRAVKVAGLAGNPHVCVIGAGGVGTHVLELVRALHPGARLVGVTGTERSAARLREAGYEAEVNGPDLVSRLRREYGSFDHVFEFSGSADAPAQAVRLLRAGGGLVFGSVLEGHLDLGPAQAVQTRELSVKGVFSASIEDLREVVALATNGVIDLGGSVSHTADLSDAAAAFATLDARPAGLVRMVLTTSGGDA